MNFLAGNGRTVRFLHNVVTLVKCFQPSLFSITASLRMLVSLMFGKKSADVGIGTLILWHFHDWESETVDLSLSNFKESAQIRIICWCDHVRYAKDGNFLQKSFYCTLEPNSGGFTRLNKVWAFRSP